MLSLEILPGLADFLFLAVKIADFEIISCFVHWNISQYDSTLNNIIISLGM